VSAIAVVAGETRGLLAIYAWQLLDPRVRRVPKHQNPGARRSAAEHHELIEEVREHQLDTVVRVRQFRIGIGLERQPST